MQDLSMLNLPQLTKFLRTFLRVLLDVLTVFRIGLRSRGALAAENLFLRKQLALYLERKKRPRRATDAVRFTMALLATFFEWRQALTIVKPDTLIRWHRKGFRLFWKWKVPPRASSDSPRASTADCQYGSQQSLMGRRANRL
jgi:putative transposase